MGGRKPRQLRDQELKLWSRVAKTTRRMSKPDVSTNSSNAIEPENKGATKNGGFKLEKFQIGSSSNVPAVATENTAPRDLKMDRKTFQKIKRGKNRPEARLDLHGMTSDEALRALTQFLFDAHGSGKRLVLVITGKGRPGEDSGPIPTRTGVLRRSLPNWVSQPPLKAIVQQTTEAHQRHGGSGAFYVYLRRAR